MSPRSTPHARLVRRDSSPVQNRQISNFVKQITAKEIMSKGDGNPYLRQDFATAYTDWITGSKSTNVSGLEQFPVRYFVNGVTQGYDIFFYEHKECRFRTFSGEYPYTRLAVRDWLALDQDELRTGDALIVTLPFYVNGASPPNLSAILNRCLELSVPVLIDAAYYGTCYGTEFDYSHPAIEMVGFSLSKVFSVQSYRIGLLFSKRKLPYLEEIQVASGYFNRVGAYVGLRLLKKFDGDFVVSGYREKHVEVCNQLGLLPTNSIMLANVYDDDTRFDDILADDRFPCEPLAEPLLRRICVSPAMSDPEPRVRKLIKQIMGR